MTQPPEVGVDWERRRVRGRRADGRLGCVDWGACAPWCDISIASWFGGSGFEWLRDLLRMMRLSISVVSVTSVVVVVRVVVRSGLPLVHKSAEGRGGLELDLIREFTGG